MTRCRYISSMLISLILLAWGCSSERADSPPSQSVENDSQAATQQQSAPETTDLSEPTDRKLDSVASRATAPHQPAPEKQAEAVSSPVDPTPADVPADPLAGVGDAPSDENTDAQEVLPDTVAPTPTVEGDGDDEEEVVVDLAATAQVVRTGGAGRFLIFHLRDRSVLAVVDAVKKAVVKEISVPASVVFAANREKLLIALPREKQLQRWDLKTLRRDKAVLLNRDHSPERAVMGAGGDGPLALWNDGDIQLWDVQRMEPMTVKGRILSGAKQWGFGLTVSAQGNTFCGWLNGISGQRFTTMRIDGRSTTLHETPDVHSVAGRWAMPSADGSMLIRYGGGIYSRDLKPVPAAEFDGAVLLPTTDPRFLLSVRKEDEQHSQATICTAADLRLMHTLEGLDSVTTSIISTEWGRLTGEPRVRYLHDENLVICIPDTTDRVVIRSLNLKAALDQARQNYLFVYSKPDPVAIVGTTYNYQLTALSSSPVTSYSMDAGPEGMTVDTEGAVRWPVTTRPVGGTTNVIILAENADGDQFVHAFEIAVERKASRGTADLSEGQPPTSPDAPASEASERQGEFAKVDETRLELPEPPTSIAPGLSGRMLLLAGEHLAILGQDGWTMEKSVRLDKPYADIGEREDYFVAIANDPRGIYLLDKQQLTVTRSLKLPYMSLTDLALHPKRPWSYVAFKNDVQPPRYKFMFYDETSGEGHEGEEWIGKSLLVAPNGRFLISGYADIYESGARLLLNPKRWHVVPEYGSLDWLIRYKLDTRGRPRFDEIKEKAGGNGKGIRMSADGKRVTYLSHVGYPEFSGNLAGWDSTDLSKIPVSYETKDRGRTNELTYHPVLPLVASPGSGSAVFFHRETGQLEPNRLDRASDELSGLTVRRIFFSPDGRHLVFLAESNGVHYLQKFPLNLSDQELQRIDEGIRSSPPESPAERVRQADVPLKDLDALRGGVGQEMTTSAIAREYTDSVVIIQSRDSRGTGFVVGADGYVLTCAHCIADTDSTTTIYRSGGKRSTSKARVLTLDEENDLALIKIDTSDTLRPVRLAVGHPVATGDHVSVIGHPGLGDQLLDYTMTDGIVSSPERKVNDQVLLQTSAAVNPGSSGAPMFNERGMVVGLVVLKAGIEGTGFAIPADTIGQFLLSQIQDDEPSLALERQWLDANETYSLEAVYRGLNNGIVTLKRSSDGREITLPLNQLSTADQRFVRMLTKP